MGGITLYISSLFPPYLTKEKLMLIFKVTLLILLIAYAILQAATQLKQMDDDFKWN